MKISSLKDYLKWDENETVVKVRQLYRLCHTNKKNMMK